ncbi:MAG: 2Fe-2S iron-sulfur cluster-binding protein [Cyclobacteriaceae bacterium]
MIQVTIDNLSGKTIYTNSKSKKLLDILQENYVDWMHACGGKGRCTTCTAVIISGSENLETLTDAERKYREKNKLPENARLSCQVLVKGNITVKVPELYKLPHLNYSE